MASLSSVTFVFFLYIYRLARWGLFSLRSCKTSASKKFQQILVLTNSHRFELLPKVGSKLPSLISYGVESCRSLIVIFVHFVKKKKGLPWNCTSIRKFCSQTTPVVFWKLYPARDLNPRYFAASTVNNTTSPKETLCFGTSVRTWPATLYADYDHQIRNQSKLYIW